MQSLFKRYSGLADFITLLVCSSAIIWGNFIITLSCILLSTFWILNGNYTASIKNILSRKTSLCFLIICSILLARFSLQIPHPDALNALNKYLPFFIFIVTLGSRKEASHNEFHTIMLAYVFSITINTIFCLCNYFINISDTTAFRSVGFFMSYIRLSLFSLLGATICIYYLFYNKIYPVRKSERIFLYFSLTWLIAYILFSKTITAYVALSVLSGLFFIDQIRKKTSKKSRTALILALCLSIIAISAILYSEAKYFIYPDKIDIATLDTKTNSGNAYKPFTKGTQTENGHWNNLYICEEELDSCWQQKTGMASVWDLNKDNYPYINTLCRYMTSKNLRKDAEGFAQLSDDDIENIKKGFTNFRFTSNINPKKRIYEAFWEIHGYYLGDNPDGHSITQRWEFIKCAHKVIQKFPWIGAGAYAKTEMFKFYEKDNILRENHWNLPHNQFALIGITTGYIGLIIFILCLIGLFIFSRKKWNAITLGWLLITVISFFSEDTMNTFAGLAFSAYFGGLILFVQPENQ
ncbi:MAG: O-antigen ligase family protein [Bacteroidales bacterium]|nr:O-antigen ligase family protein [Bacteroidales bacterium]